ncbi:hypothetical protein DMC30DRAFT_191563 [Rhodotorula diobovata]|uniref:Uncharacterized protein n=1 Tax=Rhodotorula diobovata TaxID=5288 RepID=A0A5C5G6L9_9BASI|nr:hypothetical protein DMC30DRAFT_191563 [Rhodotorula diobovata]
MPRREAHSPPSRRASLRLRLLDRRTRSLPTAVDPLPAPPPRSSAAAATPAAVPPPSRSNPWQQRASGPPRSELPRALSSSARQARPLPRRRPSSFPARRTRRSARARAQSRARSTSRSRTRTRSRLCRELSLSSRRGTSPTQRMSSPRSSAGLTTRSRLGRAGWTRRWRGRGRAAPARARARASAAARGGARGGTTACMCEGAWLEGFGLVGCLAAGLERRGSSSSEGASEGRLA